MIKLSVGAGRLVYHASGRTPDQLIQSFFMHSIDRSIWPSLIRSVTRSIIHLFAQVPACTLVYQYIGFNIENMKYRCETRSEINWLSKIRNLLQQSGFNDVWLFPRSVNIKQFTPILRSRLIDLYINEWHRDIANRSSLVLYRHIKSSFTRSNYLDIMKIPKFRNVLAKFRLSSHELNVEQGRYRNIQRNERKCSFCNLHEVEDEYHFILVCPLYNNLRKTHLKKYFYIRPSVYKLTKLLNNSNLRVLNNLSLFCIKALNVRKEKLNIITQEN